MSHHMLNFRKSIFKSDIFKLYQGMLNIHKNTSILTDMKNNSVKEFFTAMPPCLSEKVWNILWAFTDCLKAYYFLLYANSKH